MVKFDKEELMKLARLSSLKLYDSEINSLVKELKILLDYIEKVQKVTIAKEESPITNINVFREDETKESDSSPLLNIAPKTNDDYFSVPKTINEAT